MQSIITNEFFKLLDIDIVSKLILVTIKITTIS
jgi:hypothetical protein